jgi:hypothetical protein
MMAPLLHLAAPHLHPDTVVMVLALGVAAVAAWMAHSRK